MTGKALTRYTRFADGVFAGVKPPDAAAAAGYKGDRKTLRTMACRLMKRPEVRARLEALRIKSGAEAVMARSEALKRLSEQARTRIGNYILFDEDGAFAGLDLAAMQRDDQLHLLEQIETVKGAVRFKFASSQGAMDRLARMEGWYKPERHEHLHRMGKPVEEMNEEELSAELEQLTDGGPQEAQDAGKG